MRLKILCPWTQWVQLCSSTGCTFIMLVRQGQVERARHFAADLGVQIDGEISTENLGYFISLLEVTIARGIELDAVMPRIAAAIAQAERVDSRLFAAELYALLAWTHLQMGRREEAERSLVRALDLAADTGYVRFILDIPVLAPLLAISDHPAAAACGSPLFLLHSAGRRHN